MLCALAMESWAVQWVRQSALQKPPAGADRKPQLALQRGQSHNSIVQEHSLSLALQCKEEQSVCPIPKGFCRNEMMEGERLGCSYQ